MLREKNIAVKNFNISSGGKIGESVECHASSGGSASTPSGWNQPAKYELFNKIGGGFHIYSCVNPDMSFWDYTPVYYQLAVFPVSNSTLGKYAVGNYEFNNFPILTSGSYNLNITDAIGTLGNAIQNSVTLSSNLNVYVRLIVYASNGWGYGYWNTHTSNTIYSTPSNVVYSNGNVSFNCDTSSYVTAVEFYKSTTSYPYSTYSSAARQLFYEASCQETEFNYEHKFYNKKFKYWSKTNHTIGVNFMSGVSSAQRASFKGYVQQSVDIINSTVGGSGFRLTVIDGVTNGTYSMAENRQGVGEIQLWWGSYQELWNEPVPNNYRYFGTWENNASNTSLEYITQGTVKLCTEKVWQMSFQGITWEEVVECLGAGNDVRTTANSMFSDFWFTNKSLNSSQVLSPYTNDLYVLELLYNYSLPSNVDGWIIGKTINAENAHKSVTTGYGSSGTIDMSFLDSNTTYQIRVISADYDNTSSYTTWRSITTSNRPTLFSWTLPKNKGQPFNLTASEWLALQSNINQVRVSKGLSALSFTTPYAGNTFLASMYNECGNAIKGISGYGVYIPTVASGNTITGYNTSSDVGNMNIIVSELNSVP